MPETPTAGPVREICADCGRVSPVGFHVPDEVWEAVLPDEYRHEVLCIMCFARRADRQYIAWDEEITFFPVSKQTHRESVQAAY